jgi:Domain of unknown function (DUF4136)
MWSGERNIMNRSWSSARVRCRLAMLLCTLLCAACYPGDTLEVSEADVVVTLFDAEADFASLQIYAMPDSIVHIVPEGATDDISRDFDAEILAQVATNMSGLGFTREMNDPAAADAIMLVSIAAQNNVGYTGYPWGGYWGWYYPYPPNWGWGWYPWYGSGTLYTYRSGTVFMQLRDPERADSTEQKVPTVWVGALNGLVEDDDVEQRIVDGIDQAFAQSPYLGAGK